MENVVKRKKRILHVLSSDNYAGAENVAALIISSLNAEYEMAYASPEGNIGAILRQKKIRYLPLRDFSVTSIRGVIQKYQPDIVHTHDFTATVKSALATTRTPIVAHIHQNPGWMRTVNLKSAVFFLSCFRLTQVVLVADAIQEANFTLSVFRKKVRVIQNVIDAHEVRKKSLLDRSEQYDVAFIGRLADVKDPMRFIRIMAEVARGKPDLRAVMIGDGELREACEEAIRNQRLEGHITVKGFVANPFPILRSSKLLVMTSKSEGLPMTIHEALSLGKPVLVPDIPGFDAVVKRSYGRVCPSDEAFTSEILTLLANEDLYSTLSHSARKMADKTFDLSGYRKKFIEVYDHVK